MLVGTISLMAFPFLTGFYSKDLLLNIAVIPRNATATIAYILTVVAAFLTACYSVRLIIFCFITPNRLLFLVMPLCFLSIVIAAIKQ